MFAPSSYFQSKRTKTWVNENRDTSIKHRANKSFVQVFDLQTHPVVENFTKIKKRIVYVGVRFKMEVKHSVRVRFRYC